MTIPADPIPSDVMRTAMRIMKDSPVQFGGGIEGGAILRCIINGILEERERCAQIAESTVDFHDDGLSTFDAAQIIASAIRNEGEQKT